MTTPIIILLLLTSPLLIPLLVSKAGGKSPDKRKHAFWGLGLCFLFFSVGHAVKTEGMIEMLPAWVPFRLWIIYLTGILEVFIGVALFIPRFQVNAAKAAAIVLIGFFPANVYAAMNSTGLGGHQWGPVYLWIRLPLQLLLVAWAYLLCRESIPARKTEIPA